MSSFYLPFKCKSWFSFLCVLVAIQSCRSFFHTAEYFARNFNDDKQCFSLKKIAGLFFITKILDVQMGVLDYILTAIYRSFAHNIKPF